MRQPIVCDQYPLTKGRALAVSLAMIATAGLMPVAFGSPADAVTGRTESPIAADPRTPE